MQSAQREKEGLEALVLKKEGERVSRVGGIREGRGWLCFA